MRKRFERFCFKHRDFGIPNLMLYITIGAALVYGACMVDPNNYILYEILDFNRELILKGQIWRLFSYPLLSASGNIITTAILLICYYSLGRAMENVWGTLRFNLYYLCGLFLMDVYCMIFGGSASAMYLNATLMLGYATMYPDSHFLILHIIPVPAWIFGVFYLGMTLFSLVAFPFPSNFFGVVAFANYFLFFGAECVNILPVTWRANIRRLLRRIGRKGSGSRPKVISFTGAGSYEASTASVKAPHTHQCTICGRTDVSDPQLEVRYCSRCKGYHCYCQDHISNHEHIQ